MVSSSTPSAVANSSAITSTSSMSSPSLGLTNTKVTNSTAKSSGVVPNIPMVSQYIQTGMPFYQQPVYSFEDIQMMQQRMPHVVSLFTHHCHKHCLLKKKTKFDKMIKKKTEIKSFIIRKHHYQQPQHTHTHRHIFIDYLHTRVLKNVSICVIREKFLDSVDYSIRRSI